MHYTFGKNGIIDVQISNVTTSTFNVSPRAIICELQPVRVDLEYRVAESKDSEQSILDQVSVETMGLSETDIHKVRDLLNQHKDIFSTGDTYIGHCTFVKHNINLTDDIPFKQRHRRIPPAMIDEVRAHLEQLAASGIIRESHSPWASNVVLVRKRNGSLRMCVDYRQLNKRTIRDSYALPRAEELLDTLSGSKYFTVLDMKSGYHQVELLEEHKCRTAFTVGPLGFWEFNRLPFGLCNAPASYQRLMEQCLGDLNMKICCIYLDDLIIFSDTLEEHLERLNTVLNRLKECNLKLSPKKCKFLQRRVKYIGHIVSEKGVEVDPEKVEKVINWPTPKNGDEVRQFTAFAGYYRRFVRDFSKIAKPLTELHPNTCLKKGKKVKCAKPFHWGQEQEEAFEKLKNALSTPPVLGYANYEAPFEVHTDASLRGLGAVLYQKQDGMLRPISFASRGLKKSEKHYPAAKLEFLAMKWAVTEKYHDYLYGNKFTVVTDNNPLTYVLSKAKLDAAGHRWLSALASFDFDIIYRPGSANTDADILSRYPGNMDTEQISGESVKVVCGCLTAPVCPLVSMSIDILDVTEPTGQPMAQIDIRELRKQQNADPCVGYWLRAVKDKKKPNRADIQSKEDIGMFKTFDNLKVIRGLLYREVVSENETKHQLVLPFCYIEKVLMGLHNDMGHPGKDRTLSLLRDRFFWPGMTSDTEQWVSNCERCIKRKSKTDVRAPLVNICTFYPLELVCIDYLTLEPSKGNISNVLVITDHFTRFAVAIPTRNQTAKTTAEALYNEFIVKYGIPARLHSDQGANFESSIIRELCEIMGMEKSRTTIYHAVGNGMTERFNRTLISMLGTLETEKKKNWKQYIAPLVQAYNSIRHESTGFTPYMLLFGREPKLPIDIAFGLKENLELKSYSEYITDLQGKIKDVFDIVHKNADKSREKQKMYYDLKARAAKLIEGDRVLIKILAHEGKHKLADKWADDVYVVTKQPNLDIPVYKVRKEDGTGLEKRLHRNHLLHLGNRMKAKIAKESNEIEQETFSPDNQTKVVEKGNNSTKEKPVPKPRQRKDQEKMKVWETEDKVSDDESDIIVVSEAAMENVSSIEVNELLSNDESEDDEYGAPDSVEILENLSESGDAHDSEIDNLLPVEDDENIESNVLDDVNEVEEESLSLTVKDNLPEANASGSDHKERSKQPTVKSPRRSSRVRNKPKWQQSGDYCMGISKQVMMLQTLLSSSVVKTLDPSIITAVTKGISDSL